MVPLTQQLISSEFSSTRVSSFSMLSSKTATEFQALLTVGFHPVRAFPDHLVPL